MTETVKAATLKLDYTLYPRHSVDRHHVSTLVEALTAGERLPPVIADKKSKRLVDGFHRTLAHLRHFGEAEAEIEVDFRKFGNEAEILLEAGELNSHHGKTMDRHDRVHFALACEKLAIPTRDTAKALRMPLERLEALLDQRVGRSEPTKESAGGEAVPLKRTIEHMAGKTLTKGQEAANTKLGGMNQVFIFNQALLLLREDLVDVSNPHVIARIRELVDLGKKFLARTRQRG